VLSLALHRRLRQPAWLAVVLTPLAVLLGCAWVNEARGDVRGRLVQIQSADVRQESRGDGLAGVTDNWVASAVPKFAWSLGKSQLTRRITERWLTIAVGTYVALPSGPVLVAGPAPKACSLSSTDYLILRRLRL
jgi:hypothetical protein